MRSRELLLALALALALPPALAEPPTRQEVERAAAVVRQHPDLGGKRNTSTLRLRDTDKNKKKEEASSSWDWLVKLGRWLSETARVLMWIAGMLAIALLLVGLRRWLQVRKGLSHAHRAPPPSHVQSLDIRPESLPQAIGAAAAKLWQRGDHRAALSLLYRGALSRLVHAHAVPIRAASTEGECVELAEQRLDAHRSAFFARLVGAWQLAVYGARLPDASHALALCQDFDVHLAEAAA
ncbi:MAG TPA: DUF4129 domain-containing protein [Ramlibacter sp.]|uniref:DUF4129 domain-containing protein n=1 Tax=Ramlibacter sp. TaxID=1917967 RepID=UPI002ED094C7